MKNLSKSLIADLVGEKPVIWLHDGSSKAEKYYSALPAEYRRMTVNEAFTAIGNRKVKSSKKATWRWALAALASYHIRTQIFPQYSGKSATTKLSDVMSA